MQTNVHSHIQDGPKKPSI